MGIVEIKNEFFSKDAQTKFDYLTHADIGLDIEELAGIPENFLLEGIRGTGKTHVLKVIREKILENFKYKRILPVYISLAKYSEYEVLEEKEFRIHLYTSIVENMISTIKENRKIIEEGANPFMITSLENGLPIFPFFCDVTFQYFLDEIELLLKELNTKLYSGNIRISDKENEEQSFSIKKSIFELGGKKQNEKQFEYVLEQLSHKNSSKYLINFFKELKRILRINFSVLLIDEISGVSAEKQIEIFRLLKLIRSSNEITPNENTMYFIGGVYPPSNTNYPSISKGDDFEFISGEDCTMKYLEMDILTDEYEMFYKYLTKKRLKKYCPESDGNIEWLFEDNKSFLLAAFASNGLPRRYFQILDTAYEISKKKFASEENQKKIDYNTIGSAIQTIVENEILNESHLSDIDLSILEEKIIPKLLQRNSSTETKNEKNSTNTLIHIFISLSRIDRRKIRNLIYRGIVHNLNRTRRVKNIENNSSPISSVFLVDVSIAYYYRLMNVQNLTKYIQNDLRENAKRGFLYYSEIKL